MTSITFAPRLTKATFPMRAMNWALRQGKRVALETPLGVFVVPAGYQITQPPVGGCWSLETPEGMLVRYRIKPKR